MGPSSTALLALLVAPAAIAQELRALNSTARRLAAPLSGEANSDDAHAPELTT